MRRQGLDDAALIDRAVPALLDDLLELTAKRFEIRKFAFDFGEMQACDAIYFGARLGAIVG